MINGLANVFTSFGLSSSAGLNAYLPLLIVALTARFTNLIELRPPFDWLTNPWVIAVLVVLLLIETVADKIPAVDHANDVIQTVVRPAAGAILFAANSNAISNIHPGVALVCGLLLAGSVHATKATLRPVVTVTTGGLGNPVVSTVEDIIAIVVSILSILVPVFTFVALMVFFVYAFRWRRRRRANRVADQSITPIGS